MDERRSQNKTPAHIANKPAGVEMLGHEIVKKIAMPCSSSARILVPKQWVGKRVRAVRVDCTRLLAEKD